MALRKNGLGNMEENNLICDLARAHHGNPKIPKKEQKKALAHINHHSRKSQKKFLHDELLIRKKTVTFEF